MRVKPGDMAVVIYREGAKYLIHEPGTIGTVLEFCTCMRAKIHISSGEVNARLVKFKGADGIVCCMAINLLKRIPPPAKKLEAGADVVRKLLDKLPSKVEEDADEVAEA